MNEEKAWPEYKGIPVFPFKPDSIKEGRFRIIEQGELDNEDSIKDLVRLLYLEPESQLFYFYEDNSSMDKLLMREVNNRRILAKNTEWRFYRHPKFKRDYVRIIPVSEGVYKWDWEKEVVEKGPEFIRVTLGLPEKIRVELDTINKIHLEEQYRQQLKNQRYNYDVFLSYSERDKNDADLIHKEITNSGGSVFMAPKILKPGDDFAEEIRNALISAKELWLLVTPNSIKSEWVISEWGAAWALQKKIIPILLHCTHDDLPDRLKRIHCIDMHKCFDMIREKFSKKKDKNPDISK